MITDVYTSKDLVCYGILDHMVKTEGRSSVQYKKYSTDHMKRVFELVHSVEDKTELEDRLRISKFGLTDAQDNTIQGDLITFLAFAISAIALYLTMSPEVPLGIRDWVLVTIFAISFLVLFVCLIIERFRNKKRRFYLAAFEYILKKDF